MAKKTKEEKQKEKEEKARKKEEREKKKEEKAKKKAEKPKKKGKKKGMSVEEKSKIILNIYYEKREPLNLKEIEKFASKRGVVYQSIKDVNQQLVYDNYICSDRIGSSTYFWAFPSEGFNVRRKLIEEFDEKKNTAKQEIQKAEQSLQAETEARVDTYNDREEKMNLVANLKEEISEKMQKLTLYDRCDDAKIQQLKNSIYVSREACNRWCDNLYILKEWMLASRRDVSLKELSVHFPGLKSMSFLT
ncbi:unnamed protein product [Moneuplotes crassus]|uniref:Mnd1 HTH domain-containing protein n=1 Tax=Euplotes crassus TaxID=5936 RepID=A0AAD1XUD4_EUPCR|nr:unnamed protein product [Moneuplotes crassus]